MGEWDRQGGSRYFAVGGKDRYQKVMLLFLEMFCARLSGYRGDGVQRALVALSLSTCSGPTGGGNLERI